MCFHASRTDSRLSPAGEIILLDKQDRTKWNQQFIEEGNYFLNRAAFGESLSAYHVEAAIAFEHCTAKALRKPTGKEYWTTTIGSAKLRPLQSLR